MPSTIGFWDVYAGVYDGLREAIPYRRLVARTALAVPDTTDALLDAGCGTGNLLEAVSALRPSIALHGLDRSRAMLERARRRVPGATLIEGDLDRPLPWPDARFAAVTCINVLYAVENLEATLSELLRVIRPGGVLIASSPAASPSLGALVREHAEAAGWARTLPLLLRLAALLGLNLIILSRGHRRQYHFVAESRVRQLLEVDRVDAAYAGQNWFVCARKSAVAPRSQ